LGLLVNIYGPLVSAATLPDQASSSTAVIVMLMMVVIAMRRAVASWTTEVVNSTSD